MKALQRYKVQYNMTVLNIQTRVQKLHLNLFVLR